MRVTQYIRPNGEKRVLDVTKIHKEDEEWFLNKKAKLSVEDTGAYIILYADIGIKNDEGEPDEAIVVVNPKVETSEEAFNKLRSLAEQMLL